MVAHFASDAMRDDAQSHFKADLQLQMEAKAGNERLIITRVWRGLTT
jgi:hypothetical protein